jgi:uncharacterized RDD family membrane protein YckC
MTQIPADWYPDPAQSGPPGRLRYWDGQRWTEHLHDPAPVPVSYATPPPAYPGHAPYPASAAQNPPASWAPVAAPVATTPDGQRLSGWWLRVLATVIDGFIQTPLYLIAVVPIVASQWDELSAWVSAVSDSVDNGTPRPPNPALMDPLSAPGLALAMSLLVVSVLYAVVFLRWKQATPGKLIVGLRIRRREVPGALPWSTITLRVGFVTALALFGRIPYLGILFVLAALLDYLWPLWDDKKQALHDKFARTNVVRGERAAPQGPAGLAVNEADLPRSW